MKTKTKLKGTCQFLRQVKQGQGVRIQSRTVTLSKVF